jgi:hypothetical protein
LVGVKTVEIWAKVMLNTLNDAFTEGKASLTTGAASVLIQNRDTGEDLDTESS